MLGNDVVFRRVEVFVIESAARRSGRLAKHSAKTPAIPHAQQAQSDEYGRGGPAVDERTARGQDDESQDGERTCQCRRAVDGENKSFTRRQIFFVVRSQAEEFFHQASDIAKRSPTQVGQFQVVTQQVVAVQFDERVEVQQRFKAGSGHDAEGHEVDPCVWFRHPPG